MPLPVIFAAQPQDGQPYRCFCTPQRATTNTGRKITGASSSRGFSPLACASGCRGAPNTSTSAQRLAAGFDHAEVLPKLTLEQVAQQLAGARAVVSVDTGLSHLTAALDRPNITLFGPTDPGLIGGYGRNQHALRPAQAAAAWQTFSLTT